MAERDVEAERKPDPPPVRPEVPKSTSGAAQEHNQPTGGTGRQVQEHTGVNAAKDQEFAKAGDLRGAAHGLADTARHAYGKVAEVAGQVADTVKHKVAPPLLAAVIAGNTVGTPAVDGALTARVNDKNVPEQTTKANEALKESFEEFEHNLGEGMTELVARRQEDEEGR